MDGRRIGTALMALAFVGAAVATGPQPADGVRTAGAVTALATPGEVRFTAAGDYGAGANTRAVVEKIGELSPDLNLALGDLSYGVTGQEQAWCDLVLAGVGEGFPFQLLAGNHESNGMNGNINDFAA